MGGSLVDYVSELLLEVTWCSWKGGTVAPAAS